MALVEFNDVAGLSKPLKKLIEVLSEGVGAIYRPYLIRKTADAKAYEIKTISKAIEDSSMPLAELKYEGKKLTIAGAQEVERDNQNLLLRTSTRLDHQEARRQQNIEDISQLAAASLMAEEDVSDEKVDPDWISRFFGYAQEVSDAEMQMIWAKILSGEIKSPKSFSLRALELIRNLSAYEAGIFTKAARYAIFVEHKAFILHNGKDVPEEYGINFIEVVLLQELGILHSTDFVNYTLKVVQEDTKHLFEVGNTLVVINREAGTEEQRIDVRLFTTIGQELLKLVKIDPEFEFVECFASLWKKNGAVRQYAEIIERVSQDTYRHTPLKSFDD